MELESRYNSKEVEDRIYAFWQEQGLFVAKVNLDKKPFCIVIPPPNVTGILHMGHALNNAYQDILVRLKRMRGFESLWMPGTDHAGIATQNVVERQLAKEGLKRQDLGREKFLERAWQWKEEYGVTIIRQLKKLGSSCDWERARFTMDEEYSKSVKEVFVKLWDKGLIYKGDRIINWCPRCQTALSDEEAVHHEVEGNLYYIKYPLKGSMALAMGSQAMALRPIVNSLQSKTEKTKTIDHRPSTIDYVVVATTRPETMLGDTAVAVNPKDRRHKSLIGQTVVLPLVEREIKIIADDFVDSKFGTGAVKVTPAHDPNDYEMGKRHNLEFINIMRPDAVLNANAGEYSGRDRFEAREAIIEDLKQRKLLEKIVPHTHSVGHCYRCNTVVEPYLSRQWFVKMKPLAGPAIEAVKDGRIKFYPKRWTKVYLNWMENIRDWCVSRQIWWGHRLPVYYCKKCQETGSLNSKVHATKIGGSAYGGKSQNSKSAFNGITVSKDKLDKCPVCGSGDIYQDEDVLDTWFSSWLWPFATFQPEAELNYFYPTSVLVTAPEIIFFWVARMIMAGFEFRGSEPFKDVYIHGTVRDAQGKKMSKSLGNIIDPLEIIDKYGADALRFSLISITASGQDVYLSEPKFELGRNFANKLWNASRFSLINLDLTRVNTDLCAFFKKENLELPECWILSRFYSMLGALNKALEKYRFNQAANILYEFIWHEFCDWYLELAKPILVNREPFDSDQGRQSAENRNTQIVLYKVLEKTLRCLHPFMPFITEEIWQKLQSTGAPERQSASIMTQPWPHMQKQMIDKKAERRMQLAIEIIAAIRNLRSQMNVAPAQKVNVSLISIDKKTGKALEEVSGYIVNLARLENLNLQAASLKQKKGISAIVRDVRIHLELEGLIDIDKEAERINKEISGLSAS
ncbi:MAG TPA: valine--tRNA ligase, partial [Candidatus Omnitrophota bacterium]|nr:valine--tRNA ligase [Candidatus Omnitrophota bacterium]